MSNSDPIHPWQSSSKRLREAFTSNLGARKKFAAKSRTWDENQVSSPIEYAADAPASVERFFCFASRPSQNA